MVVGKLGGRAGLTSRRVTLAGLVTLNICWTSTYFEAGRPGFIVCQHTCYYHSLACVGDEDFRCKSIWGKVEGVVDRHMYVATWSFSTFLMLLNKISSNWACISTYQCMVHWQIEQTGIGCRAVCRSWQVWWVSGIQRMVSRLGWCTGIPSVPGGVGGWQGNLTGELGWLAGMPQGQIQ